MHGSAEYGNQTATHCEFKEAVINSGNERDAVPYWKRRYGGVAADELLMTMPPRFLPKVVEALAAIPKNGLRYHVPPRQRPWR